MPLGKPYCPECGQELLSDFDPLKKERELVNLKNRVKYYPEEAKNYSIPYMKVSILRKEYEQLVYPQKVFFGSWVSCCINEELTTVFGHEVLRKKICPNEAYFEAMIDSLAESISIPSNDLWLLQMEIDTELAREILFPEVQLWSSIEDQLNLWREIAYQEIVEFYDFKMKDVRLGYTLGEKANLTINSMLDNYSVAQSWNLVYYAVKDACEFLVKNGNRPHASNTVLYTCSKRMERFVQNSWPMKPFLRWAKPCPQSEISLYFFQKILKIGDKGFEQKPTMEIILQSQKIQAANHLNFPLSENSLSMDSSCSSE